DDPPGRVRYVLRAVNMPAARADSGSRVPVGLGACDLCALDLLGSAVLLLDDPAVVMHSNAAAEDLFAISVRQLLATDAASLFDNGADLRVSIDEARRHLFDSKSQILGIGRPGAEPFMLSAVLVVLYG